MNIYFSSSWSCCMSYAWDVQTLAVWPLHLCRQQFWGSLWSILYKPHYNCIKVHDSHYLIYLYNTVIIRELIFCRWRSKAQKIVQRYDRAADSILAGTTHTNHLSLVPWSVFMIWPGLILPVLELSGAAVKPELFYVVVSGFCSCPSFQVTLSQLSNMELTYI